MNKWYQPFGLLLVAAMVGNLGGCAQTSGWLSKKDTKKTDDEKVASSDSDKKSNSKSKKAKSAKELADAKSDSKKGTTAKTAKTAKSKADADREKLAAADRAKKAKSAVEPAVAKADTTKAGDAKKDPVIAASDKTTKPAAKPKTDDDLDTFLAQVDVPADAPKRTAAKKTVTGNLDSSDDVGTPSKRDVVQVKKEVAKDEGDFADWDNVTPASESKPAKTAKAVNEFDHEDPSSDALGDDWDSRSVAQDKSKTRESKESWTEEPAEEPVAPTKKTAAKRDTTRGLQDLCPQARGELRELLANLNPDDPESLKQGLHRIGQMRGDGAAAAPLLRKLLKHDDPFIRVDSALVMARLNLTSAESIAVITDCLKSRNASLRSFGSAVLGEMGPQSTEVLISLAESLNDRDGQIRLRAAEVLIRHDDYARSALQALLACLKDKDDNVRWLAAYSFAELAPESPEAVQALLIATRDPVLKVRVGAVYAIGEIGPYAKRASDELRRLLESAKDEDLKSAINHTLSQIN